MFKLIYIVTLLLTFNTAWAKNNKTSIIDETNTLSTESISKINEAIAAVKEKHNVNIQFYLLPSLRDEKPDRLAKKLFDRHNLNTGDVLFLVAKEERKSRFWIGENLRPYFTKVEVRHTLDQSLPPYFEEKNYEGAFLKVASNISLSLGDVQFQYLFTDKNISPKTEKIILIVLFFFIPMGLIIALLGTYYSNKNRLAKKYPMFEYSKAKEFEKMQATKQKMLAIIKKEYPNESVYKAYRRLTKEYKTNKKQKNKVNSRGQEHEFLDIHSFSYIPLYILMFNSPYTPMNFSGYRANSDGSSSSGCGVTSSCGSSDSGGGDGGGGGCGGGGCGGCGS